LTATRYDLLIEQGATFSRVVNVKQSDGTVKDLTGYALARLKIRPALDSTSEYLSLTAGSGIVFNSPAAGQLTITIDKATTTGFTWTMGVYDCEIESPAGVVDRILRGDVTVSKEVTH